MPTSYSSTYNVGPHKLVLMSIHINCPNCHILSSLKLSKLSAQDPISTRAAPREHPSPTPDLSDIPIDGAMRRELPLERRHREKAQHHVARHGHGHHVPGHVVNANYTGNLNPPIPHGQQKQLYWEGFGIPTRENGDAQYAIHRAVRYAYDKGYRDAWNSSKQHDGFQKVLAEADRQELDELKDRLWLERGELSRNDIRGFTASKIRKLLEEADRGSQRHQSGHKEKQDRKQRDKSRTCSHHHRSPHRNQRKRRNRSEDSSASESYDEDDHAYR